MGPPNLENIKEDIKENIGKRAEMKE